MRTPRELLKRAWRRFKVRHFCLLPGLLLATALLVATLGPASSDELRWMGVIAAFAILLYSALIWHFMRHKNHLELQLLRAKQAVSHANGARGEFLSSVSHEIRTPMNAIIGMTELMRATPLDAQQEGFAKGINKAAQALMAIIEDILDFSKIDTGTLILESIDLNLLAIVEASVDVWSVRAQEKGLRLASYVDPALPAILRGDPGRVRQILLNLLSNAVKFTVSGNITVSACLVEQDAGQCLIHFEVKDTGIGIDAQTQARLFKPFTQADGSMTRQFGGAGLGLSICQRLVDLMDGRIGSGSSQKTGSVFWFELCLPVVQAAPDVPPLTSELLLIAPDDGATHSLCDAAMAFGMTVRHVASMAAGKALINQLTQQAVLVIDTAVNDFSLDDDTYLAANVLLVAHEDARTDLPLQTGMPILLFPLKQADWYRALTGVPQQHQKNISARPITLDACQAASALSVGDKQILLVEDNLMNQQVAVHQLHRLGYSVDVTVNGEEALAALTTKSYAAILMDCQMPVMDGFETTRRIRRNEQVSGRHIPIIAMTANTMKGDRERCLEAGMDDFLSKPILREQLDTVLAGHIKSQWSAVNVLPEHSQTHLSTPEVLDIGRLSDLFEDDQTTMCAMLDLFIVHTGALLEELQQLTTRSDLVSAAALLHRLVGACANLGAGQMTALAHAAAAAVKKNNSTQLSLLCRELVDAFQRLCVQINTMKDAK